MAPLLLVLAFWSGDEPAAAPVASPPLCTPTGPLEKISRPDWVRKPSGDDLGRAYPPQARKDRLEGMVTIECPVTAKGTLANCTVVEETPAGAGFGDATLAVTPRFKMKPCTASGHPVEGGVVRIRQRWTLPD